MSEITTLELMDECIDGDREKFDALCGGMFDQFNCFVNLLRENNISDISSKITFEEAAGNAEFNISAEVSLPITNKTLSAFNCKIASVKTNKQSTKVVIQTK